MKRDPRLRVGLALAAFGILLATLVFSLDATLHWWRGSERVQVVLHDAQGLRVSDPVLFHGVPSGRVARMRLASCGALGRTGVAWASSHDDADEVRVVLDLDLPADVRAHLRTGCKASVQKTLTGVTVVQLLQGDGQPLPVGALVEGVEHTDLQDITETLHGAAEQLSTVLSAVREVVFGVRDERLVSDALEALRDAARAGNDTMQRFGAVVDENRPVLHGAAEHAEQLLARLEHVSQSLPQLLAGWTELAGTAGDWVSAARPHLDAVTEDLAVTARNLKSLSTEVRHRPWRLLHAPGRSEVEALELYQSASEYGQGALELRRTLDILARLLEGSDGMEHPEFPALFEEIRTSVSRQRAFEEALWRRLERLPH